MSDYTVVATHGKLSGENLLRENFDNSVDGLVSWPLWKEYGLDKISSDFPDDPKDADSKNFNWGSAFVNYWLHMWNRAGKINGYTDTDNNDYSRLERKVFANLRFSNVTRYSNLNAGQWSCGGASNPISVRLFNYLSSQYVSVKIGSESKYYDGYIQTSLTMPGDHKYPILYSNYSATSGAAIDGANNFMYTQSPVILEYASSPHAVVSLPTVYDKDARTYTQTILPKLFDSEAETYEPHTDSVTGGLLPWVEKSYEDDTKTYKYVDYLVNQGDFTFTANPAADTFNDGDRYILIGELYYDYDNAAVDTRYGGTSRSDAESNKFIVAGPQYRIDLMSAGGNDFMYANQGDTYFQRWDCLKTKPFSNDNVNNVIDITSVMLETHINIDGRTDTQRGTKYIASIDTEEFGSLNRVYSQPDDFVSGNDLGDDYNLDSYRSSITWSLEKKDASEIDEWSHVTLGSNLKLDGDKGKCQAIRRFQNSLIAFQDRAISEILFNSRTQIATNDGVPIEIANSGKVDGKRYITNKYGCVNKWSIVEGKAALYFVDNINKAFCSFSGQGIDNISERLGFGVWFRNNNDIESYTPRDFNNILSFHDRINSDIYLVRKEAEGDNDSVLVYNENLGAFTSFFDYGSVPMITNVDDVLVSFKNGRLWLQNNGRYCNFFGRQRDFWLQYRVTPDPYGDKIWTNLEYRADFYRVLDGQDNVVPVEPDFTDDVDIYQKSETFDYMRFWNEYQTTDVDSVFPIKKFRIWRLAIPRARVSDINPHGLDRIRNPWMNLLFKKTYSGNDDPTNQDLMQLHDMSVIYYE